MLQKAKDLASSEVFRCWTTKEVVLTDMLKVTFTEDALVAYLASTYARDTPAAIIFQNSA